MSDYEVREKANKNALHCVTWSRERAQHWIDRMGNSGMFTDKTLTKESFCIYKDGQPIEDLKND